LLLLLLLLLGLYCPGTAAAHDTCSLQQLLLPLLVLQQLAPLMPGDPLGWRRCCSCCGRCFCSCFCHGLAGVHLPMNMLLLLLLLRLLLLLLLRLLLQLQLLLGTSCSLLLLLLQPGPVAAVIAGLLLQLP
jgi:hypothetical protein